MKVDVETLGSFQRKLQIHVPYEQVRQRLDREYAQLGRTVRLHGFRPGKAPRHVLEARFRDHVESRVADQLIQTGYRDAVDQQGLEPVGQPSLADAGQVADREGFRFTITVDVKPAVELQKWEGIEVVYPPAEVTDEEVDRAVNARLEGQARLEEVERPVESGDMALVELIASDGDEEVVHEQGTMIRTEGDPYYPGVEELLVGIGSGEEKQGKVSFGDDARTEAVAGRELDVTVKVLSVQRYTVPALSDELASELGYEGGAEGMRAAIAGELKQRREEMARNQARANLLEALIRENPFDVPAGMVQQSLQMLVDELKLQQAYRTGRDPRTINFSEAQMTDLRMRAAFAAKAGLILEHVAQTQDVQVTDADLEAKYQEYADQRGQTLEAVRGYFMKEGAIEELRERLLEEKTLDWLLERAKIVEAPAEQAAPAEAASEVAAEAPKAKKGKAKKKAEPAAEEAAPATEAAAEEPAPAAAAPDLDAALKLSIGKLKEALETGAYDAHLDALEEAEQAGKSRKGALDAISSRRNAVQG